MVTPGWCRIMAAYNAEMNRRLYAAASRLPDAERREARGVFFGSLHGTLSHLLWGDMQWMSRLDGGEKPPVDLRGSAAMEPDFAVLAEKRVALDARIAAWADGLTPERLAGDLTWFSAAANRQMSCPMGVVATHIFNHQTHHRGQAHALITAAGESTGDTDLFLVVDPAVFTG
ncbi:DinB family protein [Roseomonas sp. SSH11]|uniref:DinB family protein n=1 Tax=Pararoseomonas baculiformis TaxID=2820812 RepID=A0ABS4AI80_9PROT|nr:DinB family protein [Pararoseomonas baculiformis]MBP0446743.1 DinB family protein [Pararoseomonas baculiformis]